MTATATCPTDGCGGELRAHCRDDHPTCDWKRCTRCGRVGVPGGRWPIPEPERQGTPRTKPPEAP